MAVSHQDPGPVLVLVLCAQEAVGARDVVRQPDKLGAGERVEGARHRGVDRDEHVINPDVGDAEGSGGDEDGLRERRVDDAHLRNRGRGGGGPKELGGEHGEGQGEVDAELVCLGDRQGRADGKWVLLLGEGNSAHPYTALASRNERWGRRGRRELVGITPHGRCAEEG